MEFAPSETVVLHPLRFVDPVRRGVPERALARAAAIAAVVAGVAAGSFVLEPREIPILALLPRVGRRLRVRSGSAAAWPAGSLEDALQRVVAATPGGIDLDEAVRRVLASHDRLVPDVIGFVERGLRERGIDRDAKPDPSRADALQKLIADARESDPQRWLDIGREIDRALRAPLLRHAMLARLDDDESARGRRRRARDYLESWRRLNRDPPSARGR